MVASPWSTDCRLGVLVHNLICAALQHSPQPSKWQLGSESSRASFSRGLIYTNWQRWKEKNLPLPSQTQGAQLDGTTPKQPPPPPFAQREPEPRRFMAADCQTQVEGEERWARGRSPAARSALTRRGCGRGGPAAVRGARREPSPEAAVLQRGQRSLRGGSGPSGGAQAQHGGEGAGSAETEGKREPVPWLWRWGTARPGWCWRPPASSSWSRGYATGAATPAGSRRRSTSPPSFPPPPAPALHPQPGQKWAAAARHGALGAVVPGRRRGNPALCRRDYNSREAARSPPLRRENYKFHGAVRVRPQLLPRPTSRRGRDAPWFPGCPSGRPSLPSGPAFLTGRCRPQRRREEPRGFPRSAPRRGPSPQAGTCVRGTCF